MADTPHRMWSLLALTVVICAISGLQTTAGQVVDSSDFLFDDRNALDASSSIDADDVLSVDGAAAVDEESWRWGSVRRVRRGIERLMGNGAAKSVKHGRKVPRRRNRHMIDMMDDEDEHFMDGSGDEEDETLENVSKSNSDTILKVIDDEESWRWGSVRRVRRGIERLMGNGEARAVKHGRKVVRRRNRHMIDLMDDEDEHSTDGSGDEEDETLENVSKSNSDGRTDAEYNSTTTEQPSLMSTTTERTEREYTPSEHTPILPTTTEEAIPVRELPVLQLYPAEPQTVSIGQSSKFVCVANQGHPEPSIVWSRRDGRPLSHRANTAQPDQIRFTNIALDDAGEYVCTAANLAGTVTATNVLNVQQSPEITVQSVATTEVQLTEGDELLLDCSATGVPTPNVMWFDNVQSKTPHAFEDQLMRSAAIISHPSRAVLHKYQVRLSDAGHYLCRATNAAGEQDKRVYVSVVKKRADVACLLSQFRCNDGLCVGSTAHCNGYVDCPDSSDELNCPTPMRNTTLPRHNAASSLAEHMRNAVAEFPALADHFRLRLLQL